MGSIRKASTRKFASPVSRTFNAFKRKPSQNRLQFQSRTFNAFKRKPSQNRLQVQAALGRWQELRARFGTGGGAGGGTPGGSGGGTPGGSGGGTPGGSGGGTPGGSGGGTPGGSSGNTYLWSFVCANGPQCSGSGTLITDIILAPTTGPAKVVSFFGTFGGEPILGLLAPDGWWRNDNLIISLGSELLNNGISGFTASWYFNIYLSDTPGAGETVLVCDRRVNSDATCLQRNFFGYNDFYTNYFRGDFALRAVPQAPPIVPLPAAMPLLLSALALMGFSGWRLSRRKSKDSASRLART
jgi:hypothetical protein